MRGEIEISITDEDPKSRSFTTTSVEKANPPYFFLDIDISNRHAYAQHSCCATNQMRNVSHAQLIRAHRKGGVHANTNRRKRAKGGGLDGKSEISRKNKRAWIQNLHCQNTPE